MTLVVGTITSSGIVLSADSRQTYKNNAGMVRVGSDSAIKLFQLTDKIGVAISGRAFLQDQNGVLKNTGWFVEQFRKENKNKDWPVKQTAEELNKYLAGFFFEKEMQNLRKQIEEAVKGEGGAELLVRDPDGAQLSYKFKKGGKDLERVGMIETIQMIVGGTDKDNVGRAYLVTVPKGISNERDTNVCGAMWTGQTDVLSRIVKGYAPEMGTLEFVKKAQDAGVKIEEELNKLEYVINWATMTLQDAIDFSVLITRTTESIQRFSDGTFLNPGGVTGVGGDIDIAIISPEKGFIWMKKKQLTAEGSLLDLDKL